MVSVHTFLLCSASLLILHSCCCFYSVYWTDNLWGLVGKATSVKLPTLRVLIELTENTLFCVLIAACDGGSQTNWEMQGGDTHDCYATRPCDISFAGITNIYSAVSWARAFIPTCCTASPSRRFIFVLCVGRVDAIIHTYTAPHRLFICVVSPVLSVESQRLFGSKQWNHGPPLSVSNKEADLRGMGADM